MDKTMWGNEELPYDVVLTILAWLPFSALCRLRCVCKRWKCVIDDRSFLQVRARVSSQGSMYMVLAKKGYLAYSEATSKWSLLPFSFFFGAKSAHEHIVMASAGTLLLLHSGLRSPLALSLYNPANKSRRRVSPMPLAECELCGGSSFCILEGCESSSHKVLALSNRGQFCGRGHSVLQIYDSMNDMWEVSGSCNGSPQRYIIADLLMSGNSIYCWTIVPDVLQQQTFYKLYQVRKDMWHFIPAKLPPVFSASIFDHRGKLMLVGGCNITWADFKICIWELDFERLEWVELKIMPSSMARSVFRQRSLRYLSFRVHKGCMYMGFPRTRAKLVMYDVDRDSWKLLPAIPHELSSYLLDNVGLSPCFRFLYEPRVETVL